MKIHAISLFSAVVCLLLAVTARGSAFSTMETFGDSLTAGFLSGTRLDAPPPLPTISKMLSDMVMFKLTRDTTVLARHHRPDLAWPQVLAKLQAREGEIQVRNLAVSGAKTRDLLTEVQAAPGNSDPTEAFFFIGHNDLCKNAQKPEELAFSYYDTFSKALRQWDDTHSHSVAYLVPLSQFYKIYNALKGHVWYRNGRVRYSCEDSWATLFPYCTTHFRLFRDGTLEDFIRPRIEKMNEALQMLAEDWDRKSRHGNRFRRLDDVYEMKMEPSLFAVDCYHLSDDGQRVLARAIRRAVDR